MEIEETDFENKLNYQILELQDKIKTHLQIQIHQLEELLIICHLNYYKYQMELELVNLILNCLMFFL